ncbi:IS5 family transposase [Flammeovirga aprica JL-4]|uniref:IS5 family transposase n=1 Tax=Flammeovirga aprica JL-4 TaxID=694437 RepID=A0A7X9RXR8_9BACT|nr:IS5 family transposase [Flammeovirga aprica JL-4]
MTDLQWKVIEVFLENNKPRKLCLRMVMNAILNITRTGSQWRNLDSRFPNWQSVYYYFSKWKKDGTLKLIMCELSILDRGLSHRELEPSLIAVDSQSIKLAPMLNVARGVDGNKKINGRKRHIAVDCGGRLFAVYVGPANEHDGHAGLELLSQVESVSSRLEVIRADKAYGGTFKKSAKYFDWKVDTTQSPPSKDRGFVPENHRWQVERSFAWLNGYRRLSKDYERDPASSEAFISLAFINMMLARIDS